VCVCVCVV